MQSQQRKFKQKNLIFGQSSDEDQNEERQLKKIIHEVIEIQFTRKFVFQQNSSYEQLSRYKTQIIHKIPKQLKKFVKQSIIIHQSQLSIVLLGKKDFFINSTSQKQRKNIKTLEDIKIPLTDKFVILKLVFEENKDINKSFVVKQQLLLQQPIWSSSQIKIFIYPFGGFSLSLLQRYFLSSEDTLFFLSYRVFQHLIKQISKQIKNLHQQNIIHGDICPNNILVKFRNKQIQISENVQIQDFLVGQLERLISVLSSNYEEEKQEEETQEKEKQVQQILQIKIIDFGNSFRIKQIIQSTDKNDQTTICITLNQQNISLPTQTLNYRSPQALFKKGGKQIDIWGLGHIIFVFCTGRQLIPFQTQMPQKQLAQLFSNQPEFQKLIITQIHRFFIISQGNQIKNKIIKTIIDCLKINPIQRFNMNQIAQIWK